ncbi:MAG: inositol monophosphatase [Rhodospirillaceae bacterium]|jgi:fructose-1,6-bisphosphatase/inositol monophosphatase family enzyme|nr:inositol monophosphatase [Rhodospirillaceae bacterium]
MSYIDPEKIIEILNDVSEEIILPRFKKLIASDIREKNRNDYVTVVDIESEKILTKRLSELLIGSSVVGEEAVSSNPKILERLCDDDIVWIIDPVDGTSNFIKGNERFGIIVALIYKQHIVQGWIHDPLSELTTVAEINSGTWCNGERKKIVSSWSLSTMIGASEHRSSERLSSVVAKLTFITSTAHDYLDLVENRQQFACFRGLNPWDHAAGVLLHSEAGGYSAMFDGKSYRPVLSKSGILLAPNQSSWEQLYDLIDTSIV